MTIKQLTVFVENKQGALVKITDLLAANGIDMRALSIADTEEFGILRLICENPQEVNETLREGGFLTRLNNVLAVSIADKPGSLATILEVLAKRGVDVEYTYAFLSTKGGAYMIFRVTDNAVAQEALDNAGIKTSSLEEIF